MSQPTIDALLGPGPPAGLGKMQIMRWAAKNAPHELPSSVSFAGKTVLVTGSNTGLGLEAAQKFASHGASRLILAVRTPAKGEDAKKKIVAATGCSASSVEVMKLDMSSFASVRAFARALDSELGGKGLDVAVLNAGIAPPKYTLGPEGWEAGLQVNTLSTALLAVLLMPMLKRAEGLGQLTLTGSFAHLYVSAAEMPAVDAARGEKLLEKLNAASSFHVEKSYNVLKLLTMYVMRGLVDDYAGEDVVVNVACPGFCTTDLGRDFPWYVTLPTKLMQMYYGRTAEEGSRSLVSATVLGRRGHGEFWTNDVFTTPGELVTSEQGKTLQAQAWKEIHDICKAEMAK